MFNIENILLAIESLRANKMRALLTMLGIIIGVASVIGIISVGNSLTSSLSTQLQSIGTNNIMVTVRQKDDQYAKAPGAMEDNRSLMTAMNGGGANGATDKDLISMEMLQNFETDFKDSVSAISLSEAAGSGQVKDGRLYANVSASGVNPGYMTVNNLDLLQGRFINDRDMAGSKSVCVVSDKLVNNIFKGGVDPIGQEVKYYEAGTIKTYTIVGVYKYSDTSMFSNASSSSEKDTQTALYIPITLEKQNSDKQNFPAVTVMSKTGIDTEKLTSDIDRYFSKYYVRNAKWEAAVINMSTQLATATSMLSTVSMAVAVIAAISLLVGGIGVMNIMLVSVTERTREIGTRKALGAKNYHIRMQFVTEAVFISLAGGLIGLVIGLLLGFVGSSLLGTAPSFSIPVILLTILFSMGIGVFFGYYPANKAAKLDPIEALRYE
jgi:putative ABC transport system permease protein